MQPIVFQAVIVLAWASLVCPNALTCAAPEVGLEQGLAMRSQQAATSPRGTGQPAVLQLQGTRCQTFVVIIKTYSCIYVYIYTFSRSFPMKVVDQRVPVAHSDCLAAGIQEPVVVQEPVDITASTGLLVAAALTPKPVGSQRQGMSKRARKQCSKRLNCAAGSSHEAKPAKKKFGCGVCVLLLAYPW